MNMWVNIDEHFGVPSQARKDTVPPPHWRLDAVAAVGRPHDLVVSPDRTQVAFILDGGDASDVWTMAIDGSDLRRLTTIRAPHAFWEDTAPAWSPDGTRVAFTEAGWTFVVAARGGPPRKLVEAGSPRWLDHDRLIVTVDRNRISRLCEIAVDDAWPRPLSPADGHASSPAISSRGDRIAYVHSPADDRRRSDLRVIDLASGTATTHVSDAGYFVSSPAFSPDDERIAFASERSGWKEIHVLHEGAERQVTHGAADFSSLAWSPDVPTMLLAVRTRHGKDDLVTVDVETGAITVLDPGGTWTTPHWIGKGRVVGVFENHNTPPRIVTTSNGETTKVVLDLAPAAIGVAPHVEPEVVWFPSFDGLEIPAFLFRPARERSDCPVVVYPHGGPTSHYGDEWDGHAQYFLDKGYGWLAVNFRGSTSYGREFEHAEHGTWGVADTEDCLAAHDYLGSLDWVDPARIAIFGASYGSYLAVAALARDPQHRFACGVAKYGDCDILTSWAQGDQEGIEDLERMMGHPSDNRDGYREGSPVHRVTDIERPLLIAHGEQDDRVHPKQSKQLADALRAHAKTFEYVTYPTEGHGLLRRAPQLHFYERLERFLDWYLM